MNKPLNAYEIEAERPCGRPRPTTSLSAARATIDVCINRWVTAFTRYHGLDHAALGTPDQHAQDARVDREIRALFRNLTRSEMEDPRVLERIRLAAGAVIARELGFDTPVELRMTAEDATLRSRKQ